MVTYKIIRMYAPGPDGTPGRAQLGMDPQELRHQDQGIDYPTKGTPR